MIGRNDQLKHLPGWWKAWTDFIEDLHKLMAGIVCLSSGKEDEMLRGFFKLQI